MGWHLAPSLVQLRDEVNKRWPKRSKVSDGTIGDPAHSSRASQHNPNSRGSVNAIDITNDGIDVDLLIRSAIKHPATWYVISRGYIYSRTYGFAKRRYTGANRHDKHVHISILSTVTAENSKATWLPPVRVYTRFPLPADHYFGIKQGGKSHNGTRNPADRAAVARIQKVVGAKVTGRFNVETKAKVAIALWKQGLRTTGNVGAGRWRRLRL